MTVDALRGLLRDRGLQTTGLKQDLITRLETYDLHQQQLHNFQTTMQNVNPSLPVQPMVVPVPPLPQAFVVNTPQTTGTDPPSQAQIRYVRLIERKGTIAAPSEVFISKQIASDWIDAYKHVVSSTP